MAGYDYLIDRGTLALEDPGFRRGVMGGAWVQAMTVFGEAPQLVDPADPTSVSRRTTKRRTLAERLSANPRDQVIIDRMALTLAANSSLTQSSTTQQLLAAVASAWDTVAGVYPEDATTRAVPALTP